MPAPSEPFFELSLDPLVTAGFDGYIKRTNQAWEHTLGWTEGELRAVPYAEFIHPDDRERTAAEATALARPATKRAASRSVCAGATGPTACSGSTQSATRIAS